MEIDTKNKVVKIFKILSDKTRFSIIHHLLKKNQDNVNSIAESINISQTACSHQLKILKDNNLVKFKKEGKLNIYSLSDKHVYDLISIVIEHSKE